MAGLLLVVTLSGGVAGHLNEPYYHILDDADWEAFQWVAANDDERYDVFLTHPWKAPVLNAMTGKVPLTWLNPGRPPVRGEEYVAYLVGEFNNSVWLVERDVSLVVDAQQPQGDDFHRVTPRVAQLDATHAEELHALLLEIRRSRGG